MTCNKVCEIFITKDEIEKRIGISLHTTSQPETVVNAGTLQPNKMYPIKLFYQPGELSREMKILHKNSKSTEEFSNSWEKMLYNLKEAESQKNMPDLLMWTISSTSVAVELPSQPRLPKKDNWTSMPKHEIHYFQYDYRNEEHKVNITLGHRVLVAGLHKNTIYGFYAHFFGKINEKDQNIVSRIRYKRTDEDVPDSAPAKVTATTESPTSIKLTWSPIADSSLMNGVGRGYELRHRAKDSGLTDWKSNIIYGIQNRFFVLERLKKGTLYEFKVAARTRKGSGVFSNIVQKNTNNECLIVEDDPTSFHTNILFADKALKRHVDKVIHVKTVEECFNQCRLCIEQRAGCHCESFNISKKMLEGTMVCEINSGHHKEFPSDFVDREGYQYYIVM
ncbi:cell adhesion molecule DSCAM-like [Rhopilema esculentum]|uniref:cell adhesion molecule DSCAM-like n=1 Tax=Rhopilema esculentum TaxID=499914 RepID=UPI0031D1208A